MELSWFPFSIAATVLFGVAMTLYKLPAAKNHNRFVATFWSLVVPAVLSYIFFYSYLSYSSFEMMALAFLWGITFTCAVLLQMYALSHVDTNVVFPITTTASLIITVFFGIFFFKEHISMVQILGILLAVITIFLFLYKGGSLQYSQLLIYVGSGIIFISASNKILQKIVSDKFDIHAFQIYQYMFASLFSLLIYFVLHRRDWRDHIFSGGFAVGSLIGVFSFFGGYAWYIALTKGPFSLITSVHSLYIFVTAFTAYFLFQEKITKKKLLLLSFAILAILLIRIG